MKKRVWLVMLVLMVMLFTFMACVVEGDPDPGNGGNTIPPTPPVIDTPEIDEPIRLTQTDALKKIANAIPSGEVVNVDISADFNYNDDAYKLVVQGNVKEVGSKIKVALMQGEVEKVGLYVIDNKLYITSENNATLYLQDIDVNYMMKILENGPTAIRDLVDNLLSGVGFIDFDTVVSMLLSSIIATSPELTVNGEVESYSLLVEPKNILSLAEVVVTLLGSLNIDIPIDISEIVTYLGTIIPETAINIDVEITSGVLSKLDLTVNSSGNQVISMQNSAISFTNQEVDYNFNEAILNSTEFSLTNMQFSTTLEIDADEFDVGTYVNALVGSEVIPTGFVKIDTDAFELRLDASVDLDFDRDANIGDEKYKEKNYIVLNLLSIDKESRAEKTLINIYYVDGSFYIDFSNAVSSFYKGSLIKLNLPLNSVISQTIASVKGTIDKALGITYEENNSPVITANILEDGTVSTVPTLESFLSAVLGILGQDSEKYVVVDGNTITLKINSQLISDIAGKFADIAIPDFGNGEISVTLNEYGVGSIGVSLDTMQGLTAGITLSNFNMMYEPKFEDYDSIVEYINANLDESAYANDIKTLVKSMLSATQVSAGLDLTISKGTYNVLDLLTSFGLTGLEGATLNVELTQDSHINLALDVMIETGKTEDDFKLLAEIKSVGQSNLGADVLFEDGELIIGLYVVNGSLYVDLSNVNVAGINLGVYTQAEFAIQSFIDTQLDKINKKIEVDVSNMFGESDSGEGDTSGEEGGSSGTPTALQGSIFLGLYSDSVVLDTTLSTVMSLLNALGVNANVENIDLGINAKIDSNGLVINLESTDNTFSGKLTALSSEYPINIGGLDTKGLTERLTAVENANTGLDEDIVKALFNTIASGKMTAEISVNQEGEVIDFTSILKTLISNYPFDQELKLTIEEGLNVVKADIEWNLDLDNALATTLKVVLSYGERQLVTVTVVNGNMYVDLSGFGFGKLSIGSEMTTGWINTLNTKIIEKLPKLDLNEIFAENKGTVSPSETETNEPSGEDTPSSNTSLINAILGAISIKDSQLMVQLTASTFQVIMQALGANIALDLEAELTVDIINGDGIISGKVDISGIKADLELRIETGEVVPPTVNADEFTDLAGANVNKLVRWLLSSTQVSAEIEVTLKAGTYNIIELLTSFGIQGLENASLNVEITEDTVMKLGLKVQVMLDEVVGETKMLVEVVALTDTKLGADLLFNAGDQILGLYIVENDLYLDASGINVLGIKLGVYRQVGFQLEQFLNTKINEIGKEVAKEVIDNTDNKDVEPVVLTSEGESDIPVVKNGVVVGLSANKIVLKATLSAVFELLSKVNVNVNLGDIDLNIDGEISLDTGIIINATSVDGEFTASIKALTEEYPIIIGEDRAIEGLFEKVAAVRDGYTRDEENIVKDLINSITTGTINAEINFETVDTVIDLSVLLKQLIPTFALDAPMTLVIEDTSVPLAIDLEYDIDLYNIGNTTVNLTISYGAKSLLNVIVYNGNMYLDLSGFGLGKIAMGTKLTGSWLDALAVKLSELINKINVDINDIFAENKGELEVPTGETTDTPTTDTDTPAVDDPATGGESGINKELITVILNSLNIRDSRLMLELNALAVETIFSALGVNFDIDLTADITVDLINPTESAVNGTVYIEGNKANLSLGISNAEIGAPVFAADSYVDLGSDDFNEMGMRFLQGLDLNLSIDLVNNTGSKSAVNGYNVSGDLYTRISAETAKTATSAGGATVNAGDILITIANIDAAEYNRKGGGSVSNRIYLILHTSGANAGKLEVKMQSGWLYIDIIGIIQIDVSTYIKDIYVDLGLVDILGNLIKSMYLGEITPEPPVEPDPSEDITTPKVQYADANNPILNPNALVEFFNSVDISKILEAITVNLNGLDSINARIDFNAYTINQVIDGLMNCIFGRGSIVDMVNLDLFGTGGRVFYQNYLHQVVWDRVNPSNFLNSLYEVLHFTSNDRKGALGEIVADQVPSIVPVNALRTALNDIAAKVTQFIAGILPLPVFNEIGVDVNLTDMAIANVTLEGIVDGSAVVNENGETLTVHSTANNPTNSSWNNVSYTYDEATMRNLTSHYTRLTVYNTNSAIGSDTIDGKDNGIATWTGITTDHAFIQDSYTISGQEIYETYFNNGVASSIYQLGSTYKRATSTTMSYTGEIGEVNVSETLTPDLLTRMLAYPTTYTISITSTYSDGSTYTLDYVLVINDLVIESIVSPSIYAYDDLPSTVTINYSDGTQSTVDASSLNINYGDTTALSTGDSVINAVISMYNGVQLDYDINVIGVSGISVNEGISDSITINPYEMQRKLTKTSPILNATITYTDGTTRAREIDLSGLDFSKLAYNTANTQTIAITEEYVGISWSRDFTVNFSAVTVSGVFTDEGLTECVLDGLKAKDTTMVYVQFSDGSVVYTDLYIRNISPASGAIYYTIGYDVEYFNNFDGIVKGYQNLLYQGTISNR